MNFLGLAHAPQRHAPSKLKRPAPHGSTHLVLTPTELLHLLAALVPVLRQNRIQPEIGAGARRARQVPAPMRMGLRPGRPQPLPGAQLVHLDVEPDGPSLTLRVRVRERGQGDFVGDVVELRLSL